MKKPILLVLLSTTLSLSGCSGRETDNLSGTYILKSPYSNMKAMLQIVTEGSGRIVGRYEQVVFNEKIEYGIYNPFVTHNFYVSGAVHGDNIVITLKKNEGIFNPESIIMSGSLENGELKVTCSDNNSCGGSYYKSNNNKFNQIIGEREVPELSYSKKIGIQKMLLDGVNVR